MRKLIAVCGPPCSGKSVFASTYPGLIVSSGRLARTIGNPAELGTLDQGRLFPDEDRLHLALDAVISTSRGDVIVDGVPRMPHQVEWLDKWRAEHFTSLEVHWLQPRQETHARYVASRGEPDSKHLLRLGLWLEQVWAIENAIRAYNLQLTIHVS